MIWNIGDRVAISTDLEDTGIVADVEVFDGTERALVSWNSGFEPRWVLASELVADGSVGGLAMATYSHDPYALLEMAGRALYDEEMLRSTDSLMKDWGTPLADALGVSPDTMRKWRRRKIPLPLDHDILKRALRLLQRRSTTTTYAARRIREALSPSS